MVYPVVDFFVPSEPALVAPAEFPPLFWPSVPDEACQFIVEPEVVCRTQGQMLQFPVSFALR